MFDAVGRDRDAEAGQRAAASLVLTTALGGGLLALGLGLAAWGARDALLPTPPPMAELVELVDVDEAIDEPLPEAPAPPRAALALGEVLPEPDATAAPPAPDEAPDAPPPLDEAVTDAVADASPPVGSPDGDPNGSVDGDPDGVPGGRPDGVDGGCLGCEGHRTVHHSEVSIRRRAPLAYPEAARALDLGVVDCRVRVFIDPRGEPEDLRFESCPRVFHEGAAASLAQWRWTPPRVGGRPVPAQFLINLRYVPR
jgi:hypothetical protein